MGKNLKDEIKQVLHDLRREAEDIHQLALYDVKDICASRDKQETKELLRKHSNLMFSMPHALTPWQKMCCHRISSLPMDCDVALRSVVIYALAFPHVLDNGRRIEQQESPDKYCICAAGQFEYRGDTMNSYATTVHECLITYPHDASAEQFLERSGTPERWGTPLKNDPYEWFYRRETRCHWEACVLDHYDYFSQIMPPEGQEFMKRTHTLGNFIPVPFCRDGQEFNRPRGYQNPKIQDYWDLTLLGIYKWYLGKENEPIQLINVVKTKESKSLCEEWLKVFGQGQAGWDTFVEKNYLQDFVNDGQGDCRYGQPKELWQGHFNADSSVKPQIPEISDFSQFSQFFTNSSAWIAARGVRIAAEVKKVLDSMTDAELQEKLLPKE